MATIVDKPGTGCAGVKKREELLVREDVGAGVAGTKM
jgi:hypothetical protein